MAKKKNRLPVLLLILSILICSLPITTLAKNDDDSDAKDGVTMYELAKEFAEKGSSFKDEENSFSAVGKNWGYMGPGKGTILSKSSKGHETATYTGLANRAPGDGGAGKLAQSAQYGYVLQATGLDHPVTGENTMGFWMRKIPAFIVLVPLGVITLTGKGLELAVTLINKINPFYLLGQAAQGKALTNAESGFWSASVFRFISDIYQALAGMSMIAVLFIALVSIIGLFLGTNKDLQNGRSRGIVRTLIKPVKYAFTLFVFPVILGIASTELFVKISAEAPAYDVGIQTVYEHWVDYSGWVEHSRLAIPQGVNTLTANESTTGKLPKIQALTTNDVLKINAYGADNKNAKAILDPSLRKSYKVESQDITYDEQSGKAVGSQDGDDHVPLLNAIAEASDFLMNQWAGKGSLYSSSDWEGYVKGQLDAKDPKDPLNAIKDEKIDSKNPYINDYGITVSNGLYQPLSGKGAKAATGEISGDSVGGLSTIGMYNYLNSEASSVGITYTKPDMTWTRGSLISHTSAGLTGTGLLALGNYIKVVGILVAIAFVTAALIGGLIISYAKMGTRIPQHIALLPFDRLKGMANMLKEFVGVFVKLIATVAMIQITSSALLGIIDLIDSIVTNDYRSAAMMTPYAALAPSIIGLVRGVEGVLIVLIASVILVSMKEINKAFDEIVNRIVGLLDKKVNPNPMQGNHTPMGALNPTTPSGGVSGSGSGGYQDFNGNSSFGQNRQDDENDPSATNNVDGLREAKDDPNMPIDEASNPDAAQGFVGGLKSKAAQMGLQASESAKNSKLGQLARKTSEQTAMAVSTLTGKSREEGLQKHQDTEANMQRGMASAMNPEVADTSELAGLGEISRKEALEKDAASREEMIANVADNLPSTAADLKAYDDETDAIIAEAEVMDAARDEAFASIAEHNKGIDETQVEDEYNELAQQRADLENIVNGKTNATEDQRMAAQGQIEDINDKIAESAEMQSLEDQNTIAKLGEHRQTLTEAAEGKGEYSQDRREQAAKALTKLNDAEKRQEAYTSGKIAQAQAKGVADLAQHKQQEANAINQAETAQRHFEAQYEKTNGKVEEGTQAYADMKAQSQNIYNTAKAHASKDMKPLSVEGQAMQRYGQQNIAAIKQERDAQRLEKFGTAGSISKETLRSGSNADFAHQLAKSEFGNLRASRKYIHESSNVSNKELKSGVNSMIASANAARTATTPEAKVAAQKEYAKMKQNLITQGVSPHAIKGDEKLRKLAGELAGNETKVAREVGERTNNLMMQNAGTGQDI